MSDRRISDLFQIRQRFLRSTHIERDWRDPSALDGYVATRQVEVALTRLVAGLDLDSGHRAWRITGDYGSGKSSFALLLAHLLSGQEARLAPRLRHLINWRQARVAKPRLLPVLVTGRREPLGPAILRAMEVALLSARGPGKIPKLVTNLQSVLASAAVTPLSDETVVRLVEATCNFIATRERYSGLLLVIDELGKFLEFSVLHPDRQDIYLLQALAELAARSGSTPIFLLGILHQGFSSYAEQLPSSSQKEWEKVGGRFDEILWTESLDQTAELVAHALQVDMESLPPRISSRARRAMKNALKLGWYGPAASEAAYLQKPVQLYPLHPSVLPPLIRLFSRYGQNERSLFSFLLGSEPFGLFDFSRRPLRRGEFYRICDLYDYAYAAFGYHLHAMSFRTHWGAITSVVNSYPDSNSLEMRILKTIGLLNALDNSDFIVTDDIAKLAVSDESGPQETEAVAAALERLKQRRLVYYRGASGGYCLWPHASVNLDHAYEVATKSLGRVHRVAPLIKQYLESRPIVARRHYIETGALRHFVVEFISLDEWANAVRSSAAADGRIVVVLCETEHEHQAAIRSASSPELNEHPRLLVAIPRPLTSTAGLLQEVQRWVWVRDNTPELASDSFALEEVSRQMSAAKQALERGLQDLTGLQGFGQLSDVTWFHRGQLLSITGNRHLLNILSDLCDDIYRESPRIHNELINRRSLSTAAAAARMRLIERLLRYPNEPYLGMDPMKKPPEMSMYLSVLVQAGLHKEYNGVWSLSLPEPHEDACHIRPTFAAMMSFLETRLGRRVSVDQLFSEVRQPPLGLREGLIPLLLAVFSCLYESEIAFFENGSFLPRITGPDFLRLIKAPATFSIQYTKIGTVESELFRQLYALLSAEPVRDRQVAVLDVVRPLLAWASRLPSYTRNTSNISETAQKVRSALFAAREPSTLLLQDLPEACGFQAFSRRGEHNTTRVENYVQSLKQALDELSTTYPRLLERMKVCVQDAWATSRDFGSVRKDLGKRASSLAVLVLEPRLKAFCMRLSDQALPEDKWLESLGAFVCQMPSANWTDHEYRVFEQVMHELAAQFHRIEAIHFGSNGGSEGVAMRIVVTLSDGHERSRVIQIAENDKVRLERIQIKVISLIEEAGELGVAAVTRAIWNTLAHKGKQ